MIEMSSFKDAGDKPSNRFESSFLGKEAEKADVHSKDYDAPLAKEVNSAIKNKLDGLQREHDVEEELERQYLLEKGYSVISEAYLRNENGTIVKDTVTGEARRIDFVVAKDEKVVDSIEVTSKTADKTAQTAKEVRIREAGGNYIRDYEGNLIEIPSEVHTRIERRN